MSSSPILPRSNNNTFPLSAARKLNLQPRAAAAIDFNDSDDDDENGLLSADYKAQRRTTQDLVDFFKTAPPPPSSTPIPLFTPPEEEKKKRSLLQRLRTRKSGSSGNSSKSSNIRASSIISSTTMGNATVGLASNRSSVLVPGQNGYGGGSSSTLTAVYANSKVPGTSSSISATSGLTISKSKIDNSDKRSTMSSTKKYVMISIDYAGEGTGPGYPPSITSSTLGGGAYGGSNTRPSSIGAGVGVGGATSAGSEGLLGSSRRQSQLTERGIDDFANLFSSNNRLSLLSSGTGIGLGTSFNPTTTTTPPVLTHSVSAASGLSSSSGQLGGGGVAPLASQPMSIQETAERRSMLLQTAGLDATPFLLDNFGLGSDFLNGISISSLSPTCDNNNSSTTTTSPTTALAVNMGSTSMVGGGNGGSSSGSVGAGLSPTTNSPTSATASDTVVSRQSINGGFYGGSNTLASTTPVGTHQRTLSVLSTQTSKTAKPFTPEEMAKSDTNSAPVTTSNNSQRNSRVTFNAMQHIFAAGSDGIGHHAQLLLDEDIVTEALLQRIESHKARKLSHQSTTTSSSEGATLDTGTSTAADTREAEAGLESSEEAEITLPKPVSRKKVRHVQIQTMHCVTRPMYTQTEPSEVDSLDDLEIKAWRDHTHPHHQHHRHHSAGQSGGERRGSACSLSSQTEHKYHNPQYRSNGLRPSGLITSSLGQPTTSSTSVTSTTTATSTLISTTTTTTTTDYMSAFDHCHNNNNDNNNTMSTQTSNASMSLSSPSTATLSTATMTNHSTMTSACSSPSSPCTAAGKSGAGGTGPSATTAELPLEQELALMQQQNLQLQQQVIRLERELASEIRARARSAVAMQDTRDKFEMLSALAYKKLKEMIFQRHLLEMEVRELKTQPQQGATTTMTTTTAMAGESCIVGKEVSFGMGSTPAVGTSMSNALVMAATAAAAPNAMVTTIEGDDANKAALMVACAD
ncbi:hypothetical protein DFQ27_002610 [Actinomortierella ambigua]|uniref:Uncharacterized protein n=1 Tax=Actinomortierella ambigua TaxID=1343610 RepID=A0A9P6QMR6_9FUNG|nr:hypothetical protein DFQ27_002610 [Actinomortierella ambigua]